MAVRAFVTARRSGEGGVVTCPGEWPVATVIPAASSAAVYGGGPPASQPVTEAPECTARIAAPLAPAPAAPTTWIRSPGRIGRASRAGARPAPTRPAADVIREARRTRQKPRQQPLDRRCRRGRGTPRSSCRPPRSARGVARGPPL